MLCGCACVPVCVCVYGSATCGAWGSHVEHAVWVCMCARVCMCVCVWGLHVHQVSLARVCGGGAGMCLLHAMQQHVRTRLNALLQYMRTQLRTVQQRVRARFQQKRQCKVYQECAWHKKAHSVLPNAAEGVSRAHLAKDSESVSGCREMKVARVRHEVAEILWD
uniref:Uncharacterized protein n=1 Tax=Dunaliella tertiolecta TaxID=3047 RepID=A0A7S3QLQ4_DUNTE